MQERCGDTAVAAAVTAFCRRCRALRAAQQPSLPAGLSQDAAGSHCKTQCTKENAVPSEIQHNASELLRRYSCRVRLLITNRLSGDEFTVRTTITPSSSKRNAAGGKGEARSCNSTPARRTQLQGPAPRTVTPHGPRTPGPLSLPLPFRRPRRSSVGAALTAAADRCSRCRGNRASAAAAPLLLAHVGARSASRPREAAVTARTRRLGSPGDQRAC